MAKFTTTAIAALALALSGAAFAQEQTEPAAEQQPPVAQEPAVTDPAATPAPAVDSMASTELKFEELDKDGDGSIAQSDVPADSELATSFATHDTDKDSKLSKIEFDAYQGTSETEEAE